MKRQSIIENNFTDKKITCCDCGEPFTFSAREQEFFADKGLQHERKRCKPCNMKKNERMRNYNIHVHETVEGTKKIIAVPVVCDACGRSTTVPFVPTNGRPVYCRLCFEGKNKTS
ncbi:MAG: hypothetical protein RIQ54_83 [Candidatus Parcubacteria bacterium]|jgi:CxxC-x17-CxxC domain-containing protein